jgi:hypothetical protein
VGEAFKRMRAAQFDHQNDRHYQGLVERDLLRVSRATETRFEVTARVANDSGASGLDVAATPPCEDESATEET